MFAIDSDDLSSCELINGLDPVKKAEPELIRIDASKDPAESIVRRDAVREFEEGFKPGILGFAKQFELVPAISAADRGADGDGENINELMTFCAVNARIRDGREMFDKCSR